jgi:hypothetical protein
MPCVDRDDPPPRGIEIGEEVKDRAVVPEKRVARVEVVEQVHHRSLHARTLRVLQVEVVDSVPPVGAEPHVEHHIAAVVRHLAVHPPVGLVGSLVHQQILLLLGPESMIVETLEPVQLGERLVARLRVPAVEKAGAVLGP